MIIYDFLDFSTKMAEIRKKILELALDIFKDHNFLFDLQRMTRQRMIEVALKS